MFGDRTEYATAVAPSASHGGLTQNLMATHHQRKPEDVPVHDASDVRRNPSDGDTRQEFVKKTNLETPQFDGGNWRC